MERFRRNTYGNYGRTAFSIEPRRYGRYGHINESGQNDRKFMLTGLRPALVRFSNSVSNYAKNGRWGIGKGGYDRWWELYYDGNPVIDCVGGKLEVVNDYGLDGIEKVIKTVTDVYDDVRYETFYGEITVYDNEDYDDGETFELDEVDYPSDLKDAAEEFISDMGPGTYEFAIYRKRIPGNGTPEEYSVRTFRK